MPFTFRPADIASTIRAAREAAASSISLSLPSSSMEGQLDGTDAELWLHAVDDGGSELVVSWVGGGSIRIAHVDPSAGVDSTTGKWAVTSETEVVPATYNVKDTWHIFAAGYHWISFSIDGDEDLYVVALDTSFSVVWGPIQVIGLLGSGSGALVELENNAGSVPNYSANDHFMVSRVANGVEIGVRYMNASGEIGHYVVRLDSTGALVNEFEFLSSSTSHGNLASADRVPGTWPGTDGAYTMERQVLAPSAIADADSLTENELLLIRTRNNWSASAIEVVATWPLQVDGNDVMIAMATQVRFGNGWRAVTFRYITDPQSVVVGDPDDGYVGRWLFDETLTAQPTGDLDDDLETLSSDDECNRPHTMRFGDYLVTCWDTASRTCWMRVEEVSY